MAIKSAIKADTIAYTTPATSTMKVFSALGFAIPVAMTPAGTTPSPGIWHKLLGYKQGLVGGLVSFAAAASVFLLFLNHPKEAVTNNSVSPLKNNTEITKYNIEVPKTISQNTDAVQPTKVRTITKVRYVDVPRYVDTKPSNETIATNNEQNNAAIIPDVKSPIRLNRTDIIEASREHALSLHYAQNPGYNNTNFPEDVIGFKSNLENDELGLSVEYRGSTQWYTTKSPIVPMNSAAFDNSSFGVFKKLSDEFSIGIEGRQEKFYQDFKGTEDGIHYRYQQQANYTSGNIALRYTSPINLRNIHPMLQGTFGVNNAGYIGRAMTGARWTPYTEISFILGIEYSHLFYEHQGNSFGADKFNFNYGFSFNF
jgi:hypothetical protein